MERNTKLSILYFGLPIACAAFIVFASHSVISKVKAGADLGVGALQSTMLSNYDNNLQIQAGLVSCYEAKLKEALAKKETLPAISTNEKSVKKAKEIKKAIAKEGLDISRLIVDKDGTYVYLIKWGDNLTKLSRIFGYSVDELADFNCIRDVNLIYAESSLRIPNGDCYKIKKNGK